MAIDPRLLDSACQANIDENFNRTLGIVGDTLPAIATGDAGKVLTVNDDEDGVEWASGGGGGGGSVLEVPVTELEDETLVMGKTASEVAASFPLVVLAVTNDSNTTYSTLGSMTVGNDGSYSFTDFNGVDYEAATGDDYPATPDVG